MTAIGADTPVSDWGGILRRYFAPPCGAAQLQFMFDSKQRLTVARAVGPDALFDALDSGPVEQEYSHGRARFDRCDPFAIFYTRIHPELNSANRIKLFRRLIDVAAQHNRFKAMDCVRTIYRREADVNVKLQMKQVRDLDAAYQRVHLE